MIKKIFTRKARLVEAKTRWYIDFTTTNLLTSKSERSRKDFGLNDIPDLTVRRLVGETIAQCIEQFIIEQGTEIGERSPNMLECIRIALDVKLESKRKSSHKNYKAVVSWMEKWAKDTGNKEMSISQFQKRDAKAWRGWLKKQKNFTGRSINNYIGALKTLWNELIEQEYIETNPWCVLKPERKEQKKRRVLTDAEVRIIASEANCHYWMFRVIVLIYYCHIRPTELTRLKFKDFDLDNGLIHISAQQSKTWKGRVCTIPTVMLPFFQDVYFDRFPKEYYWLGREWKPNPQQPLNPCRLFRWHNDFLNYLQRAGKLLSIEGITLYSWKDTGISHFARAISLIAAQDQAGHRTVEQTLLYYHPEMVNEGYKQLDNRIGVTSGPDQRPHKMLKPGK